MSDTGTFSIPGHLRLPDRGVVAGASTEWQRVLVSSLEEAEAHIDELRAAGREHQLVVLGPSAFAVEWR